MMTFHLWPHVLTVFTAFPPLVYLFSIYHLQLKTAVRRVFCSYLNLLVNSKNDVALALTLDIPSRSLGRQAFTDVKRAARTNDTSLFLVRNTHIFLFVLKLRWWSSRTFHHRKANTVTLTLDGACFMRSQAVTSFVRAIQLGGRSYAPAESDPLRKHIKGLSDFVQFVDNLEEILGEVPDPR